VTAGEDEFKPVVGRFVVDGNRGGFIAIQRVGDIILGLRAGSGGISQAVNC
jgi:hypothetical protein